ncbi:MAG: hypothetical protein A2563_05040 [Candidatus Magasanikbacteria bacterium RIFOXYD1_FULL_40_23]|uniref:Uncharacterized protein n=1 Tax=Candidatus Magasanikbacteria bacterium RIFOXYD1_FULL_40_23 TaxID=1798705 RepID=A0A1F6P8E6_9BACT|nr:MAG: hypothetical protein A2563_05040 [Candidatus Magasanikbacteria bacterium RIFOXYD1_FULL_40_23]
MAVYTLVIHLLDLPENLADASCIALLAPFVWSYTDSKKIFKGSSVPVGQILFNRAIMMIVPFLILRLFFGIVLKL